MVSAVYVTTDLIGALYILIFLTLLYGSETRSIKKHDPSKSMIQSLIWHFLSSNGEDRIRNEDIRSQIKVLFVADKIMVMIITTPRLDVRFAAVRGRNLSLMLAVEKEKTTINKVFQM